MKSIQSKFITFIVIYMVLLAAIIASVSVVNTNRITRRDSEMMLDKMCAERVMQLDYQLKVVEHSVETIYGCAKDRLVSAGRLADKQYRDEYTEFVRRIAIDLANQTDGSLAVYFRYNPNLYELGNEGFFWTRNDSTGVFAQQPVTDLLLYDTTDVSHVGWYYIPVRAGKSIWMSPYENLNIQKNMISYVIPFYLDNRLIGVIGMDIDFDVFTELAQDISTYEGSSAYLIDMISKEIYTEKNAESVTLPLDEDLYYILGASSKSDGPRKIKYDGETDMLVFDTLSNQMRFAVMVPLSELNKGRDRLLLNVTVLTVVILVLAILMAVYFINRFVRPIKDLTAATKLFAEGNWDVTVKCETNDEVKILTDSVLVMAEKTQSYIEQLNQQAMVDGLTGVKNKACYLESVEKLKEQDKEKQNPYAIVMCDVNGLKHVNDTYGHEVGDRLIIQASRKICEVFVHSPVFRIGGDEFAVIMQNQDYARRQELIELFAQSSESFLREGDVQIPVSVAFGMGVFPDDADNFDDTFALADERMYQKKHEMKGEQVTELSDDRRENG